jgi:superfamily II DNA or RNA helicase
VQRLARHLDQFPVDRFGYLIIDEAHHATADTYQRILGHFQAKFTLGLSATPERSNAQSILEIFQDTAHRLSLEEAVKIGALTPIRCIRVKTNVDLSKVRFNHIRYNARDLEQKIMVASRDELIVATYRQHVSGKRAVIFAVNVRHAERLAELFQAQGIPAAAVSGGDATMSREQRLRDFESGHLWVL